MNRNLRNREDLSAKHQLLPLGSSLHVARAEWSKAGLFFRIRKVIDTINSVHCKCSLQRLTPSFSREISW